MQHKGSILRLIQLAGAVLVHKYSQLVPTVQAANCYLKVFWLSSLEWAVRMENEDCTVANWGESPGHYKPSASPLTRLLPEHHTPESSPDLVFSLLFLFYSCESVCPGSGLRSRPPLSLSTHSTGRTDQMIVDNQMITSLYKYRLSHKRENFPHLYDLSEWTKHFHPFRSSN